MAKNGRSALFVRLLRLTNLEDRFASNATVADVFESVFSTLKTVGLRDEYVYRAALTQKVLMGIHSLNTACMLNEFRSGACKADLVILNGTATVYEIKSERDSLARLAKQVENYKKVFAKVYIISSDAHVRGVRQTVSDDVGVLCLSPRFQITTIRDAIDRPDRICPTTVFESLRSAEACAVLKLLGVSIPDVPNTQLHTKMRECFQNLRPEDVHTAMVNVLKRTRDLAPLTELVGQLPPSLHAAALSVHIHRSDHNRLVQAAKTPLVNAMAWT